MTIIADNPEAISRYRAIVCKGALKLLCVGITPGRGWSKKTAMKMASEFTGKKYGRLDAPKALADMTEYVKNLSVTPQEVRELGE